MAQQKSESYKATKCPEAVVLEYLLYHPNSSINEISGATGYKKANVDLVLKRLDPLLDGSECFRGEGKKLRLEMCYSVNEILKKYTGSIVERHRRKWMLERVGDGFKRLEEGLGRQIERMKGREEELRRELMMD